MLVIFKLVSENYHMNRRGECVCARARSCFVWVPEQEQVAFLFFRFPQVSRNGYEFPVVSDVLSMINSQ